MALKRCCCGLLGIKMGSFIIGYTAVISSCLWFKISIFMVILGRGDSTDHNEAQAVEAYTKMFLMTALFSLKILIFSSLMVYGMHKTKPAFVLPWIIGFGTWIMMQSLLVFGVITSKKSNFSFEELILIILGSAVINMLEIYILLVVSSHYHNMKKATLLFDDDDEEELLMSENTWKSWCSLRSRKKL